ncbi:M24 family metallopeptidase [Hippea alviniae]|uniref:M24 family metallopeptidase n=1 Tax=Hippea alviniae TaxID=1279027 RepID=UPI0003B35AA5|nr:Xaa-Pro peptidase family protein [Hippea alviniae]
MREEILKRIEKLSVNLDRDGIDAAIIMQNTDIYYYSGTMPNGALVVSSDKKVLFAIRKGLKRAEEESPINKDDMVAFKGVSQLPKLFEEREIKHNKIGIEMDVLPTDMFFRLKKAFPDAEFVDISPIIRSQRAIKSEKEIELMRESARMLDCTMQDAKEFIKPHQTEIEISAYLEYRARLRHHQGRCRMRGFNGEMLMGHVHSGPRSTYPNGLLKPTTGYGISPNFPDGASKFKIEENISIIVDFLGNYQGYLSDETRIFVIGKLDKEMEKAYYFCLEIMNFLEETAKEGASTLEIYNSCIEKAKKAGYEDNFMGAKDNQVPFVGHGIGLEVDEYPFIAKGLDFELKEGMTFAFEPKVAFEGKWAVGVENTYLVKKDGVESLTRFPREIVYL